MTWEELPEGMREEERRFVRAMFDGTRSALVAELLEAFRPSAGASVSAGNSTAIGSAE